MNAQATVSHVTLNSNITSGIPPLKTFFVVSTEIPNAVVQYQMDFEGDGVVDYAGTSFDNVTHTYIAEGVHHPRVTITDDQGNVYSDTIAITVLNREKIDALLTAKWEGMKGALMSGDVEGALGHFSGRARVRYRLIFNDIKDQLSNISANMQPIDMIWVENGTAQYRIGKSESEGEVTYFIYFVVDGNGLWRIQQF